MRHTRRLISTAIAAMVLWPSDARADEFEIGSFIIPMDTDYQDAGMLRAYGLVYELLRNGVAVRWVIAPNKQFGGTDFTAQADDVATGLAIGTHDYRGGPWVVDAFDALDALPIIEAWQLAYPETTVHEATADFDAPVARYLVAAPTIAMVADGNEDIARGYMQAAGIPDSVLDPAWPDDSPDMLDITELAGPTETNHADGSLFDEDGDPVYCQLMSMHWGVGDAENNPEVVAEVRSYLNNPTHFFAECQAVNAFENLVPHGFFLTPNGFEFGGRPDAVDFYHADSPFGQLDGEFETVGGSEPSYTLPAGDQYKAGDVVMVTAAGTPEGVEDVWMTGFLDGQCPPEQHECGPYGKVSYLGGHEYRTDMPMTENPDAQGVRLFLNSLFEAPCATVEGLPNLAVAIDAPAQTTEPDVTFKITYVNSSFATALDVVLVDTLPDGATFVSATGGGALAGNEVSWDLGNLGPGESGDLEIEVHLEAFGVYDNLARLDYRVGLNGLTLSSNLTQTEYADMFGTTGTGTDGATGGSDDGSASGTGGADTTSGSGNSAGSTGPDPSAGTTSGNQTGTPAADPGGCGCTSGGPSEPWGWLTLLTLAGLLRRRTVRGAAAAALVAGCSDVEETKPDTASSSTGEATSIGSAVGTGDTDGSESGEPKLDLGNQDLPGEPPEEGCEAIDFLFVIDSSESMKDHQANLVASFPGFAAEIESSVQAGDWHVMVVGTDAQWGGSDCANACSTLGVCPDEPGFDCSTPSPGLCDITIGAGEVAPYGEGASNEVCIDDGHRYLAGGQADLAAAFSCIAQVGVDGSSEERTAEAMVRALDPGMVAEGGCNAAFLRDEAILVITIITDEPDPISEGEPPQWYQAVVDAKAGDESAIVVLGLLPDADGPDQVCGDPVAAPRLGAFLDSFPQSSRASVCELDYSPFFVDAVEVIAQTCEDYVPPVPQG